MWKEREQNIGGTPVVNKSEVRSSKGWKDLFSRNLLTYVYKGKWRHRTWEVFNTPDTKIIKILPFYFPIWRYSGWFHGLFKFYWNVNVKEVDFVEVCNFNLRNEKVRVDTNLFKHIREN